MPGLWLDPVRFWAGDLAGVMAVLRQGLASPEHATFVSKRCNDRLKLSHRGPRKGSVLFSCVLCGGDDPISTLDKGLAKAFAMSDFGQRFALLLAFATRLRRIAKGQNR